MVERKEKKYSLKAILIGVSLAVATPFIGAGIVNIYEKYGDENKLREKINSYVNEISLEELQRLHNWFGIDVEVNRKSIFEEIGNFFRGY